MKVGVLGAPSGVAEGRVLLAPRQVGLLDQAGVEVLVETGAGARCGVQDADYAAEGATILGDRKALIAQSEVVLSVARPGPDEAAALRPGATLMGFYHFDVHGKELVQAVRAQGARVVALERARTDDGRHPFRERMAEVAGVVACQLAARLLESGGSSPGYGLLLGGLTGVPPARVAIVGAGSLGRAAAAAFAGTGADVTVLDKDLRALDAVAALGLGVSTQLATPGDVADAAAVADVLVAAVRVPDGPPPKLLSVFQGKPGAVWLDLSIDEGGCIEESRAVWSAEEAYTIEGVTLCPVPNLASWAARTATRLASALLWPALLTAAEKGRFKLEDEPWLLAGAL
jgi:alanine dehydrogenase